MKPETRNELKAALKAACVALVQQRLKVRSSKPLKVSQGLELWDSSVGSSTTPAFTAFRQKLNKQGLWKGGSAGAVLASADVYRKAYRLAAAKLHPDAGGDLGAWTAMQNAAVLLEEHHKGASVSASGR